MSDNITVTVTDSDTILVTVSDSEPITVTVSDSDLMLSVAVNAAEIATTQAGIATEQAVAASVSALQAGVEPVVNLGNVSGSQVMNMALGTIFVATVAGNCSWSVINPQPGVRGITLELTNGNLTGQTFPGVKWPAGFQPNFTVSGTDIIEFFSRDNWTTIRGVLAIRDSK